MRWCIRWLLLLLWLTTGPVMAQERANTVMVIGDSLSAAYGIERQKGWVNLLRQRLNSAASPVAQQTPTKVVNAAISGDTTYGGRARLPALLKVHKPQLVIVELGANDALRVLPFARMQANLEAMLAKIKASGAKAVLIAAELPASYGPDYVAEQMQAYTTVAENAAVPMVRWAPVDYDKTPDLVQEDGLHPSAKAQPLMLEVVWPVVQRVLHASQADSGFL